MLVLKLASAAARLRPRPDNARDAGASYHLEMHR